MSDASSCSRGSAAGDARLAATAATYDRIAGEYAKRSDDGGSSPDLLAWRTSLLGTAWPLVDLGCGPGRDLAAFATTGMPCLGVDLSAGMVAIAGRRGLPVVRGDLRAPPLRPGSVGTVYSCTALLHVPREQVPATLQVWRALLRPGGRLHLSTSLGEGEGWEVVPYAADGGPQGGQRLKRWFVHHELDALLAAVTGAGLVLDRVDTRTTHRTWGLVSAHA